MQDPIIYYDGLCGLCDRAVQFVLRHDSRRQFRFATLQSQFAADHLGQIPSGTFVYQDNQGRIYLRSSGALKVAARLDFPYFLLSIFLIVPTIMRDPVYDWIAGNRNRWFGHLDHCRLPRPEEKDRFIGIN